MIFSAYILYWLQKFKNQSMNKFQSQTWLYNKFFFATQQCQELAQVLQQYPVLFSGKLGLYPHCKVHLDLIEGTKPIHLHPYADPHVQVPLFKKSLNVCVPLAFWNVAVLANGVHQHSSCLKRMARFVGSPILVPSTNLLTARFTHFQSS